LLKALGFAKDAVVKNHGFYEDMSYAAKLNERYAAFFGSDLPARSMIQVAGLP